MKSLNDFIEEEISLLPVPYSRQLQEHPYGLLDYIVRRNAELRYEIQELMLEIENLKEKT